MKLTKHLSLPCQPSSHPLQPKIQKITGLLSKAICEVRKDGKRSTLSPTSISSKRVSNQSSECETVNEVLQNLKRGYLVVKHSSTSDKKGHKFVYISADNRHFCWKSADKDDEKKIELISIQSVIKEGSQFYIKSASIQHIEHCLVIRSEQKKLQLECASQVEAEYLRYELVRAVRHSRNMRLNYLYLKE